MHVYRVDARRPRNAGHARSAGCDRDRRRRREERVGVFHRLAGECRRSAICIAPRSTVRPSRPRHAGGAHRFERYTVSPDGRFAFTGSRDSTTRASASSSRCPRTSGDRPDRRQRRAEEEAGGAHDAAGRVCQGRRRRRRDSGRLRAQAGRTSTPRSGIRSSSTSMVSPPARRSKTAGADRRRSITAISPTLAIWS